MKLKSLAISTKIVNYYTMKFRICYTAQNGEKSIIYNSDRFLITLDGQIIENYGKDWRNPVWEVCFDCAKPPVIQLFTGHKDKNGKEIYDGDILSWYPDEEERKKLWQLGNGIGDLATVEWCDVKLAWIATISSRYGGEGYEMLSAPGYKDDWIVVGNIFEHSNLFDCEPIKIGKDGRCHCDCGDKCPLEKSGMEYRCTEEELQSHHIKTVRI
jgi:YopX protein